MIGPSFAHRPAVGSIADRSIEEYRVDEFSPNADELVANNRRYADGFHDPDLQVAPTRRLAVVACMDSRMDIFALLGLSNGEAHVIRNAGGIVTDDVVRSLTLSQRLLGTREILLAHHTDCGLQKVDEPVFLDELEATVGSRPSWPVGAFSDPYEDTRHSIELLRSSPYLVDIDHVRGFVYDVTTGLLREV